jgi:hypothetical protein
MSKKIASAEWGDGVVDELAATIARQYPRMRGYTRPNLFRSGCASSTKRIAVTRKSQHC